MANDRTDPARIDTRGSTLRVPRSRGALSGTLLVLLGIWGAAIPFVGPAFSFAFTPDKAWTWTAARGWLEVLPGAVTLLGGLILLASANRLTASFGAWLGVAGGAWFVVGPQLAGLLHIGSPGTPASTNSGLRALESLAFFYGLGALIIFFAAGALGRLSVLSVRDVRFARRREAAAAEARAAEDRAAARRAQRAEQDRSAGSRDARQREDVQNDSHAHRHFGFRRGASTEGDRSPQAQQDTRLPQGQQPGREQQDPGYQPAHLDERSSGARSSNDR